MTGEIGKKSPSARFWQNRAFKSMPEMRLARRCGLFPKKEGWRNVVEHMLVVSEAGDILAEETGGSLQERRALRQATLLHDISKRRQKELTKEKGNMGQLQAFREQVELLEEMGYSKEVIELTASVGHPSLINLVENPEAKNLQLKEGLGLPVLIIHYADDITRGSEIVGVDKRVDDLENRDTPYPEVNMGGDIFGGRTYYQAQRIVGHLVEDELASRCGVAPDQLVEFIKSKIDERVATSV